MKRRVYREELTPLAFLARSARVYPDRTAVVHGARRTSYAEFAERVARLSTALARYGVMPGECVAVLSPNSPAVLEANFAVPRAGAVLVPVNVRLAPGEIATIVEHSSARLLLVDAELEHLSSASGVERIRIDDSGERDDPYEAFLHTGADPMPPAPLEDEEAVLSINYTSGTTGRPKGAMVTHRGSYLNALGQVIETGLASSSVYLWTLPMFHCNGWCFPWAVTAVAATHVCLRKVDPGRVWELLAEERVTHLCCAPTVAIALANHPSAGRLPAPVTIVMGGAPPSPTLLDRLAELDFRPMHAYGLTETYGPITACTRQDAWSDLDAGDRAALLARQGVGHVTAGPVRLADESATMAEVLMRGNTVMKGYFDDPEETERAFDGGWFHSGDLAIQHADGYLELRDRAKDIVVSGGENIATIEVEQTIAGHPAVLECAVVAIPDEHWGERPKAFVCLKPGATATEREIIDHCRERIAHFKCPDAVEFGELPKTSTGKIQKFALRAGGTC